MDYHDRGAMAANARVARMLQSEPAPADPLGELMAMIRAYKPAALETEAEIKRVERNIEASSAHILQLTAQNEAMRSILVNLDTAFLMKADTHKIMHHDDVLFTLGEVRAAIRPA